MSETKKYSIRVLMHGMRAVAIAATVEREEHHEEHKPHVTKRRGSATAIQTAINVVITLIVGVLIAIILFAITQQALQTVRITQPTLNQTASSFLSSLQTVGNFLPVIVLSTIGIVVIAILLAYLAPHLGLTRR